jgi:hypothetical protein
MAVYQCAEELSQRQQLKFFRGALVGNRCAWLERRQGAEN